MRSEACCSYFQPFGIKITSQQHHLLERLSGHLKAVRILLEPVFKVYFGWRRTTQVSSVTQHTPASLLSKDPSSPHTEHVTFLETVPLVHLHIKWSELKGRSIMPVLHANSAIFSWIIDEEEHYPKWKHWPLSLYFIACSLCLENDISLTKYCWCSQVYLHNFHFKLLSLQCNRESLWLFSW